MKPLPEKKITFTQSEIDNAQEVSGNRRFTIAVRPRHKGGFWVAMVDVDTGMAIDDEEVNLRTEISAACRNLNRMMDKCGWWPETGRGMFDKSRHRSWAKHQAEKLIAERKR